MFGWLSSTFIPRLVQRLFCIKSNFSSCQQKVEINHVLTIACGTYTQKIIVKQQQGFKLCYPLKSMLQAHLPFLNIMSMILGSLTCHLTWGNGKAEISFSLFLFLCVFSSSSLFILLVVFFHLFQFNVRQWESQDFFSVMIGGLLSIYSFLSFHLGGVVIAFSFQSSQIHASDISSEILIFLFSLCFLTGSCSLMHLFSTFNPPTVRSHA